MVRILLLLLASVLAASCTTVQTLTQTDPAVNTPSPVAAPTVAGPGTVAFHLDMTNQSFDIPDVRLRVTIDDDPVVDDVFPVRDQHHVVSYDFFLEPGNHVVVITAPDFDARLDTELDLSEESWANLSFWDPSEGRSLVWNEYDEPPGYD